MNPAEQSRRVDDARAFLDRLRERLVERFRRGDLARLELYGRRTIATRLSRGDPSEPVSRSGMEDGLAVRLQLRYEDRIRFSAASGSGRGAVDRAVFSACNGGPTDAAQARNWPPGDQSLEDLDPLPRGRGARALARWLERAWQASADAGLAPRSAWVERAITIEAWVSSDGGGSVRRRARGWALLEPGLTTPSGGSTGPSIVAARRFDELDPGARRARYAAPESSLAAWSRPSAGGRIDLELTPEPAARLVHALVRTLSVGPVDDSSRLAVGPGWTVEDCPRAPEALFGGLFDDSAHPTRSRRLADGRELIDRLDGPGNLRRASFRDPPEPMPSHLAVRPAGGSALQDGVRAAALRLHVLEPRCWVLEVEGVRLAHGEPVAFCPPLFLRVTPRELVERCSGGHGPRHSSYLGVSTPALIFRDLDLAST